MSSFDVFTTLHLILPRYCCWSQPFRRSERPLILHSKGGYLSDSVYTSSFTSSFSGNIVGHCWNLCHLHVLWPAGAVGKNIYLGSPFIFPDRVCLCKPSQWGEGGVPVLPQQKWPEQPWVVCPNWDWRLSSIWASKMAWLLWRSKPKTRHVQGPLWGEPDF